MTSRPRRKQLSERAGRCPVARLRAICCSGSRVNWGLGCSTSAWQPTLTVHKVATAKASQSRSARAGASILEAIRKPFRTVAARSRSLLAVMKCRATTGRDSIHHKMYITDLDHSSTGFYTAFVVLTVPAIPAMPGIRPLNHPAFLQRREAFRACRTHLDFDAPAGTMLGHPGVEGVIVILLVRKDRLQTRQILGCDMAKQDRCCDPIIETSAGNQDGQQQPQRIDQQMPLATFDFLAPIIPALRASHLGGLDRLTIDTGSTGGRLAPCGHTNPLAQGPDQLRPCPIVTPLGKIVIDGTLGQHIMRQQIPLAATAVQGEQRLQDFPHVDLPRTPSSWVLFGGWDHRSHDGPLLVRQIRGIGLPRMTILYHMRTLLC